MPKRRKASKTRARVDKPLALADWKRDPLLVNIAHRTTPEHCRAIKYHLTTWGCCLLCGVRPATFPCVFSTPDGATWGGASGEGRVFCYHLCAQCRTLPNVSFRVEARFQADTTGARN